MKISERQTWFVTLVGGFKRDESRVLNADAGVVHGIEDDQCPRRRPRTHSLREQA
jgi:hypothetical protein